MNVVNISNNYNTRAIPNLFFVGLSQKYHLPGESFVKTETIAHVC